ncbi:hypothetical protein BGZ83_006828 [Gryganskiella cystojenkinii]|nr:hypothetical protein BGZ83_006828 [Gryganskiella cystojenkinii]
MNPSSSYEAGSSSTPIPQRGHLHKSPYDSSSPADAHVVPTTGDRSSGSGSGRQRVRTEPSPRHPQQPSSGWLGSYNEHPPQSSSSFSPMPTTTTRSPRGPRQSSNTPDRTPASDRILDTHKALGSWQLEGGNSSTTAGSEGVGVIVGWGLRRRNFDGTQSGNLVIEPSNSIQSLVESIDDDHVFKLTEMTKKRVEHNNPTQKRQRVVSLPTSEVPLATQFQPSEKTIQLSNSCKIFLETRYTQLYKSINDGHPINRLEQLRQILPRIKEVVPRQGNDSKTSMDSNHSRPLARRSKGDKYRFVDKVEESSCIWDLEHMEARANAEEQAESAARAKAQARGATSTESFMASSSSRDSILLSSNNRPYMDSPLAAIDSNNNFSASMSPSSTTTSISHPQLALDSTSTSSNSLDSPVSSAIAKSTTTSTAVGRQSKEFPGESKLRLSETTELSPSPPHIPTPTIAFPKDEQLSGILESLAPTTPAAEASPSKRGSFLGIFGNRHKKIGQEGDHHYESPQSTSSFGSPRLGASGPILERRSLDSQHSPYLQPFAPSTASSSFQRMQQQQPNVEIMPSSKPPAPPESTLGVISGFSSKRTSIDEEHRAYHFGDPGSAAMTDDENGGHYVPPTVWPQGEREDSQDESDTAIAASQKRSSSSIRKRFTDKMLWKRGPKALSTIHLADTHGNINTSNNINLDGVSSSPRVGPTGMMYDSQTRMENKSPMLNPTKSDSNKNSINTRSPMITPSLAASSRGDKSPMMQSNRSVEKSPLMGPSPVPGGEDVNSAASTGLTTGGAGQTVVDHSNIQAPNPAPQLLIDVDRIPKRMLQRLKLLPELSSVIWTSDTVDLSVLLTSSQDLLTYDEYVGITSTMKESDMYPTYLDEIDVLQLHLTLGQEEAKDILSKERARKWDQLELRVDQELELGEKWIKDITTWSRNKADAIQRHCRTEAEGWGNGEWHLDSDTPLVEEPEEEQETSSTTNSSNSPTAGTSLSMFSSSSSLGSTAATDQSRSDTGLIVAAQPGEDMKNQRIPPHPPLEAFKARKQQRELSLTSTREMHGSISSLHASTMTYSFKASLDSTRESVAEMRVYLAECRDRLFQLEEATGAPLQEKEPVFKDIVDKFTMEWNESYFVALKEVEDQIQVMNLKRIENPWMDMLLIMLSWVIRGLFYIVEGVTIMIIIVRHAWKKAKNGYEVIRNARREQERLSHQPSGTGLPGSIGNSSGNGGGGCAPPNGKGIPNAVNGHARSNNSGKTVGAWS